MFHSENIFEADIQSQPESMRQALRFYREQGYFKMAAAVRNDRFDKIILTGMGSSYAASINAGAMLRTGGLPAYTEVASDLLHYHYDMITDDTLLIMVSQSGGSGEVVELCEKIPHNVRVLAITNDENSALARRAQQVMVLHVDDEVTVSTRTYLSSQILMYMLAKALLGEKEEQVFSDLELAVQYLTQSIDQFVTIRATIENHIGIPPYLPLIGRGWSYATTDAGALFIREVSKYPSISYESAQFRHGPIELVDERFACMVFVPKGLCEEMQLRIVFEILAHGGKVVVVAEEGVVVPEHPKLAVIRQKYVSQELAPIGNIVPVQAFADYVSKAKGYDVSVFRCGSKITDVQ